MSKGHAPNVKLYLRVFAALAFLTVVTVFVSYLHLPITAAVLVALVIATLKASLVAAFFMHLKGERALIYGVLAVTLFFTGVLFVLPISDSNVTRQSPAAVNGAEGPAALGLAEPEAPAVAPEPVAAH
jgi:cytochrome c oxidase subunit IV